MVFVFGKDSDVQNLLPKCGTVRSQAPDVTVSVGLGESKQEFKCYKVILSFASDYLDAMLSSSMKEGEMNIISFPDKDPEEWKLFYDFISPQNIGKPNHIAEINNENVTVLLPWFHELSIDAYVNECDVFLSQKYLSKDEKAFWGNEAVGDESEGERLARQKSKFDAIIGVLNMSKLYDLTLTRMQMERRIVELLNMLPQTHALFDLASVKVLLRGLPFELDNIGVSKGLRSLETICKDILSPFVSTLSQDIIDDEDRFCGLFYCYMKVKKVKAEKDILQREKEAAVGIIRTVINDVPNEIYQTNYNRDREQQYKKIISKHYKNKHKQDFQDLGITLPEGYP